MGGGGRGDRRVPSDRRQQFRECEAEFDDTVSLQTLAFGMKESQKGLLRTPQLVSFPRELRKDPFMVLLMEKLEIEDPPCRRIQSHTRGTPGGHWPICREPAIPPSFPPSQLQWPPKSSILVLECSPSWGDHLDPHQQLKALNIGTYQK